jgi:hypothetical protein
MESVTSRGYEVRNMEKEKVPAATAERKRPASRRILPSRPERKTFPDPEDPTDALRIYETGEPVMEPGFEGESDRQIGARLERNQQRHNDWAMLSAQDKTQLAADTRFDGPREYAVSIPADPIQPRIIIRANSPEEAQARYAILCGIIATQHQYQVELVCPHQAA